MKNIHQNGIIIEILYLFILCYFNILEREQAGKYLGAND